MRLCAGEQKGTSLRPDANTLLPNGSTLLKRKQLTQLGYAVVSVPFWEWQALEGEQEQSEYLEGKFEYS